MYMVLHNNSYNSVLYFFKNQINKINTAGILFILNLSKLSDKQSSKTWEMSQVNSHNKTILMMDCTQLLAKECYMKSSITAL